MSSALGRGSNSDQNRRTSAEFRRQFLWNQGGQGSQGIRWLGCQVLEAKNESPTRLLWQGKQLRVQHGFRPHELIAVRDRCGPVRVSIERKFRPYT